MPLGLSAQCTQPKPTVAFSPTSVQRQGGHGVVDAPPPSTPMFDAVSSIRRTPRWIRAPRRLWTNPRPVPPSPSLVLFCATRAAAAVATALPSAWPTSSPRQISLFPRLPLRHLHHLRGPARAPSRCIAWIESSSTSGRHSSPLRFVASKPSPSLLCTSTGSR